MTLEEAVMSPVYTPHGFNYSFIWLDSVVPGRNDWKLCRRSLSSWFRYLRLCFQDLPPLMIMNMCFISVKTSLWSRGFCVEIRKTKKNSPGPSTHPAVFFPFNFCTRLRPIGWHCLLKGAFGNRYQIRSVFSSGCNWWRFSQNLGRQNDDFFYDLTIKSEHKTLPTECFEQIW